MRNHEVRKDCQRPPRALRKDWHRPRGTLLRTAVRSVTAHTAISRNLPMAFQFIPLQSYVCVCVTDLDKGTVLVCVCVCDGPGRRGAGRRAVCRGGWRCVRERASERARESDEPGRRDTGRRAGSREGWRTCARPFGRPPGTG